MYIGSLVNRYIFVLRVVSIKATMLSALYASVRRTVVAGAHLRACSFSVAADSGSRTKLTAYSVLEPQQAVMTPLAVTKLRLNSTPFEEHLQVMRASQLAQQTAGNRIVEYESVRERPTLQITPTLVPFVTEHESTRHTGCEISRNDELGNANELFETTDTDETSGIRCTRKDQRKTRRLKMKKHKRKKWLKKYGLFFREKVEQEEKKKEAELQKWFERVRLSASGFDPKAHVNRLLDLARRSGYYVDVCRDLPPRR